MQKIRCCFFVYILCLCHSIHAQIEVPFLERKISITGSNITVSEIFKSITKQTTVLFSYNSILFNDARKINLNVSNQPLRLVLEAIFKGTNQAYKLKQNYIIIYQIEPQKLEEEKTLKFSGYVCNNRDSSALENVSIYLKNGRHAVLSNAYGYFAVNFSRPNNKESVLISIAKENYNDTTVIIDINNLKQSKIYLSAKRNRLIQFSENEGLLNVDSIVTTMPLTSMVSSDRTFIQKWLGFKKFRQNLRNINDTLFSNFSLSLLPIVSTNKLLSINTINKTSVNLFIGYSKGTKIAEVGGFLNIDNGNVKYVQAAGAGNVVTDSMYGVQAAGVFNIVNKHVKGIQMAGLFNTTSSLRGVQLAGLYNYSFITEGMQAAGAFNLANKVEGLQVAGVFNSANTIKGTQLSGLFNYSKEMNGTQVSGLVNIAKKAKGVQLSIINVSDTMDGIPIGLFSFVRKGYKKMDVSTNELLFGTIGFRTGVEKFHNIIFSGININPSRPIVTIGYGLGTLLKISNTWCFNAEASAQFLYDYKLNYSDFNTINRLFLGTEYRWRKKSSLAFGPTLNYATISYSNNRYYESIEKIIPSALYSSKNNADQLDNRLWLGFNVSMRFF
jgi:hypothetical protein